MVKNPLTKAGDAGDVGLVLGREDPLEEEMATPSSISCLENPMDRGAWQTTVYGVTELNITV